MQYIDPSRWNYSEGINPSGKVFVARWLEAFNRLTIDIFRVRHLNFHHACEELQTVTEAVESRHIDIENVKLVSDEAWNLLTEDPIADIIFPHKEHYYQSFQKPLIDRKGVHTGFRIFLASLLDTLRLRYFQTLCQQLEKSLKTDDIQRTLHLTQILATEALSRGFDFRYLFWRGEWFLNPPKRPFSQKLSSFLADIAGVSDRCYQVVFRLIFPSKESANNFPSSLVDGSIVSIPSFQGTEEYIRDFLKGRPDYRYCVFEDVQAFDPFSAAKYCFKRLSGGLDIVQFAEPSSNIRLAPTAAIINPATKPLLTEIHPEILGSMRVAHREIESVEKWTMEILLRPKIPNETKLRIVTGLRYLRLGLTDEISDGQILNLWIGLESLLAKVERGQIASLRQCVSQMMSIKHIGRLALNLREDLKRCKVLSIDDLEELLTILLEEAKRQDLINTAAEYPLLQHRIRQMANIIRDNDSVLRAIRRHQVDVEWHIQRLYRIRNSIVHGGPLPKDLTGLVSNLAAYLWTILTEIIESFSLDRALSTIDDVIEKYVWLFQSLESALKREPRNLLPLKILLNPKETWPA